MPKIATVLIFIGSLLCFHSVFGQAAQGALAVTDEKITVSFPDSIFFQANALNSANANIEKATLIYGTTGRACQTGGAKQTFDIEPDVFVELDWEWELKRSGSLPPGTTIWWQWEIEDANGGVLLTERQEQTIRDERSSWRSISQNGINVEWIEGSEAFAQGILDTADESLGRISESMGVPRPEAISLFVYPDAQSVRDALVYSSEWAGGVAFPDYGITILGIAPGQDEWQNQVVPHELAHLVVGTVTFNCYGVDLPTWLNEGLARFAENYVSPYDLEQLDLALAEERLPSLRSQANGFSAYGGSASLSYTQGHIVVKYLIDEYGAEKMNELLNTVQEGSQIDDALEQVYGFDTDGLDAQWRGTTGYEATPTSAADALALEATATMIPTIALANPLAGQASSTPEPTPEPKIATLAPTVIQAPTETEEATAEPSKTIETTEIANLSEEDEKTGVDQVPPVPVENGTIWPFFALSGVLLIVLALVIIFIKNQRSS